MSAVIGPMTFLQLCQSLQQESGTSGAAQTTVVGATGEWKRLCDWVAQAYVEIQLHRDDWEWMEQDVVFNTIANQQAYDPVTTVFSTPNVTGLTDFRRWKLTSTTGESSFRLYLASAGIHNETWLDGSMSYAEFRDFYIYGARRDTYARPISICQDPQKRLLLGLGPNDIYTVDGKYYQAPILLSLDGDTPAMPARYHQLIVWWALEKYGFYESAQEVITRAQASKRSLLIRLEAEQLPDIEICEPLA